MSEEHDNKRPSKNWEPDEDETLEDRWEGFRKDVLMRSAAEIGLPVPEQALAMMRMTFMAGAFGFQTLVSQLGSRGRIREMLAVVDEVNAFGRGMSQEGLNAQTDAMSNIMAGRADRAKDKGDGS